MRKGDKELAKEAFDRAQLVDPDYALAWFGGALVGSESGFVGALSAEEADKLFDHSYELSQGSIVCESLVFSFYLY
jgi:hypothetical protein